MSTSYKEFMDKESISGGQLLKKANQLKRAGKLDEAIALYHQVIEINPNFAWAYYELGDALAKNSQHHDAAIIYQRAIDVNQKSNCFSHGLERMVAWGKKNTMVEVYLALQ